MIRRCETARRTFQSSDSSHALLSRRPLAALQLTRLMGSLLFQVSPRDPLAFGDAVIVTTLASLAACVLTAWHATRTDPFARSTRLIDP